VCVCVCVCVYGKSDNFNSAINGDLFGRCIFYPLLSFSLSLFRYLLLGLIVLLVCPLRELTQKRRIRSERLATVHSSGGRFNAIGLWVQVYSVTDVVVKGDPIKHRKTYRGAGLEIRVRYRLTALFRQM